DEDTAVTINVLANDSDLDGDALTVSAVTQGTHGSVAINTDGSVTYTPGANFNGGDSFTYTVSDGNGGTATATVTLGINALDDGPVANDDTATTNEDTSVTINLTANDSNPDGGTVTVSDFTQGHYGFVTLNGVGSVTYTPTFNFNGSDSFTYTIENELGATATATVFVTINPVNDPPIAGGNLAKPLEDTPIAMEGLGNE